MSRYNQQQTAELRERLGDKQLIRAEEFFVWTIQAQHEDRSGTVWAGKQVKAEFLYSAPKWMIDRGLIVDAADSKVTVEEGQSELFEF
ncbi:hypothetical protein [Paenibacillus shenyangensis]|uniref:hypothetical protein n=1 Tax=Paenibacillus sp. A9 TaxID=1284352 RepID=UPI0003726DC1|nr:hypothetical protein [Paenibacillus sp. A9]